MKEGTKVSRALAGAGEDVGTVIDTVGIVKVRVLWWDGEETVERPDNLKEVLNWKCMTDR